MPNIDLSILNQRQTPAFFADTLANRPAAGFLGRIFVSTDTFAFYRDNGTGWDLIGGPGTGTITGTGASGQIALWNGASTITGDTGLTYDGTANSLTADKFIVSGGTSSQFLKANGSVDSNSYVPYTGANASLNMGANNLSGQNYFINGNDVNSGGFLGIKQFSGSSSGQLGYTSISALTQNSLYFQFSQTNGTNKTFEISAGLLGTSLVRQFLLPDASGTFALTSNIPSVSGVAGQVSYFNGTNSITGSNDLFWDSVNGHLGIGTNVPGTALQIDHDQSQIIRLNQTTATNDTKIAFQNSGTALWRIGNSYNAGANDFGIFDVVGAAQPFTIKKTTGQTFIGAETTSSGRLVVNNATGDNHIVVIGATAPSIRVRNAGVSPTRQFGLGLATTTNNFIQGTTGGEFCIFNGSTAASPILFGITNGAVIDEVARFSSSYNFLIGTTTDAGFKLAVNGTTQFSGKTNVVKSIADYAFTVVNTDSNGYGIYLQAGGTNNAIDVFNAAGSTNLFSLSGTGFATFVRQVKAFCPTTTNQSGFIIQATASGAGGSQPGILFLDNSGVSKYSSYIDVSSNSYNIGDGGANTYLRIANGGNVLIGTTTDAGEKLQVNGSARIINTIRLNANGTNTVGGAASIISNASNTYGGLSIVWGADGGGNIFSDFIYYSLGSFNVLASQSVSGAPAGRTYSVDGSGNLLLSMAAGTYTVRYQALLTS